MQLQPLGDRAVVITLGSTIDEATHRRVRAVCARLDVHSPRGMIEYVPAFASVTVHYNPVRLAVDDCGNSTRLYKRLVEALELTLSHLEDEPLAPARTIDIPVCYGGELGPDLEEVARVHGLTPDEVVRIHASGDYLVYMVGFTAGFPYLGGLSDRIATPRRLTPRERVPASTVAIGGKQTGVYPIELPGGWHLIGRTPLKLFSTDHDPPTLLTTGDRVRFHAISVDDYRHAVRDR